MQSYEYLCFQAIEKQSNLVFEAVEHGFNDTLNQQTGLHLSNFIEFSDSDLTQYSDRKRLRQAIIVRAFANRVQRIEESTGREQLILLENECLLMFLSVAKRGINPSAYPGVNCLFFDTPSVANSSDPCRQYYVFDKDLALPEFFVEYSLESDLDRLTTRFERLMVDIAYSSKLSQADMPAVVLEVGRKIAEEGVF
jgi:hypothetical protein